MLRFIAVLFMMSSAAYGLDFFERAKTLLPPFGISSGQPPSPNTVTIIDAKISLKAAQVCGYTDWSNTQIKLPSQLLSKKYWDKVGNDLIGAARKAVLQLSGALPGMIICDITPQFCSIYNQSELMAAFEMQLTFDTCKILDGISNTSGLQADGLRKCVAKNTASGEFSAGRAREKCLATGEFTSKDDKIAQTEKDGVGDDELNFDMNEFITGLFPDKIQGEDKEIELNSGGRRYSRFYHNRAFMKELFPGINLTGRALVQHGGTFQRSAEKKQKKEAESIRAEVERILAKMVELQEQGYAPKQIVERSESMWKDHGKWIRDGKPSAIYRPAKDDEEPTFLISPAQIVMLLPLADKKNANHSYMSDELREVINQLAQNAGYVKTLDIYRDMYEAANTDCETNPKFQTAVAQKNCNHIRNHTKTEMEHLMMKQESEERAFVMQMRVARVVRERELQTMRRLSPSGNGKMPGDDINASRLMLPGAY